MTDAEALRSLVLAASNALERSRQRIDDLNVYPVPDGDTGTNLALTVRGVAEALETSAADDGASLAREVTRAALMSARGNSGVILSQIVRGAAEELGRAEKIDAAAISRALRAGSDEAYRAIRKPVEGTMLTVIRELAEEAEAKAGPGVEPAELFAALVRRGEDAVARTQKQLDVLRDAGVVDAGGAGLLELVRGLAAALAGEELLEPPPPEELSAQAVHRELSRFRYCTTFVIEGDDLDADRLESELDGLGDSVLVVGDRTALKAHVHTDDPGAALSFGTAAGAIEGVEIADMHRQTEARAERLLEAVAGEVARCAVVAVVAGEGNRRLFESLGTARVVEGGQTMNPATADLLAAVEATGADKVVLLPNNANVVSAAEQAARLAGRHVEVVPTRSLQAGLAALVAFNGEHSAQENAAEMARALDGLATGEVTTASRDATVDGLTASKGDFLGLLNGQAIAAGPSFAEVARAVAEGLLAESRDVLTLLTGEGAPPLNGLLDDLAERHPELEIDVHEGGQPHYPLLLSAE
ncbi:MAG: DAK2 domain-containing protein [Gaiellaceae bacterium]